MKVIILAGGWGSRLGEITNTVPKPMVEIGDKPVLWHIMKIYSHYNYKEFILCLGVKANIIKTYFNDFALFNNDITIDLSKNKTISYNHENQEDWKVTLANTGINTLKGARLKRVEKYLDNDINMLTYGDGVADINIHRLVAFHKSHGKILTITGVHPPARFGEIVEKDGLVTNFEEKSQVSRGLINGGFMVFHKKLLDYLTEDENCDLEIGPLQKLVGEQQVMVYKHEGNWACMDHERDVKYLNGQWNSDRAFWKVWD